MWEVTQNEKLNMVKDYRFDHRTKKEFAEDIKSSTKEELRLFKLWLKNKTPPGTKFKATGCGSDGEFLSSAKASSEADFYVDGIGPIEVKFAKPFLDKVFHLKVTNVLSYIKQGASILMFNGSDTKNTTYTLIPPIILQEIKDTCKIVDWQGMGAKPCFRINIDMLKWETLT